jgi:hypothetical protein
MESVSARAPLRGDVHRGVVAVLLCILGIGLSTAHPLPGHSMWPLIAGVIACFVVASACVLASKARAGVIVGILLVLIFRILIGGYFYLVHAYRGH